MKILSIFSVIALCAVTLFTACGGDGDAARDAALDNAGGIEMPIAPATGDASATPEPPQNASGVWHYTCPNGCAGGGGAAAPCPKCGTTLAHNQAYHAGDQTAPPPTPSAVPEGMTPVPNPTQAATPEPAQNASGVWHYTCPKGCAGGGGSATACAKCGSTLAHNQTYHQ